MTENTLNSRQSAESFRSALRLGVTELGFLAVLVCVIAVSLNYFNVLPLSKSYPSLFSWLPHKKATLNTSYQAPVQSSKALSQDTFSSTIDIPVANIPGISQVYSIGYQLTGIIKDVHAEGFGYKLQLDTSLSTIPVFTFSDITLIEKAPTNPYGSPERLRNPQLKAGQKVTVKARYVIDHKVWITDSILLYSDASVSGVKTSNR